MSRQDVTNTLLVCAPDELPVRKPEERWLIEHIWPREAVGILGGPAKSMKTFMALELAVSVASNTTCLGAFDCDKAGRVLVYAAEDNLADLRQRLVGLCAIRRLELGRLDLGIITEKHLHLDRREDVERLEATLAAQKPVLLVLDPFVRLHRGVDENSSAEVSVILGTLRRLQRQHHTAIALVHHARKRHSTIPGQALRGSGDFHAWVDVGLYLNRRNSDDVLLTIEHRSAQAPKPFAIMLAEGPNDTVHLRLRDGPASPKEHEEDDLQGRIVSTLGCNGPLSQNRLRRLLKTRNQSVTDAIKELSEQGVIEHTTRGWRPRHDQTSTQQQLFDS